jgi:AraC family transcriptional regulator, glycine betaine-responsive activator
MIVAALWNVDFHKTDAYDHKMDSDRTNAKLRKIGILPIDGFALLSYASCAEPFRAANLLSKQPLYEVVNISTDGLPVQSSGSANITPQAKVGDALSLDWLFIVAGGNPTQFRDNAVLSWLNRLARLGVQLGGVSGGPVILALAGLMKGRRMTVHWEHAAALAEISPGLLLERSLFVIDRDRVTCAGGTAAMDLMHSLISQHHGNRFAHSVSDWFMHTDVRPSAGPQRGGLVERLGVTTAAILDAVKAMESHVADPLTLSHLAESSGVSARQLNRLFTEKLGRSTMGYYRDFRLEKAQNLLRNSPLSLTEIALATGFSSSSHFSRTYSEKYGHPPSNHMMKPQTESY